MCCKESKYFLVIRKKKKNQYDNHLKFLIKNLIKMMVIPTIINGNREEEDTPRLITSKSLPHSTEKNYNLLFRHVHL